LFEWPNEDFAIKQHHLVAAADSEFVLIKSPIIPVEIRANYLSYTQIDNSPYSDYIIIFVIRNPYNVFTSLIKDGVNPLNTLQPNEGAHYHVQLGEYIAAAKFFLEAQEKNYPNVHAIKYEDFFPNNFEKLKLLMDTIGLKYSEDIFTNRSKKYIHSTSVDYDNINPEEIAYGKNRLSLRTWQINQPFQNMNSEVNIPEELSKQLSESEIIKKLGYSDPRITG
jgi:hypothetical protein